MDYDQHCCLWSTHCVPDIPTCPAYLPYFIFAVILVERHCYQPDLQMSKVRPWEYKFIKVLSKVTQLVEAGAGRSLIAPSRSHWTLLPGHPDGLGNAMAGWLLLFRSQPSCTLALEDGVSQHTNLAQKTFLTELNAILFPLSATAAVIPSLDPGYLDPSASASESAVLPVVRLGRAEREGRRLWNRQLRPFSGMLKLENSVLLLPPDKGGLSPRSSPGSSMCPRQALPVNPAISVQFESVLGTGIDNFPHGFSFWHLHCN